MSLNESLQTLAASFGGAIMAVVLSTPIGELTAMGAPLSAKALDTQFRPKTVIASARAAEAMGVKAAKPSKAGRLPRRTPEQFEAAVGAVVALLKKNAGGLRAEAIRIALELDVREVPAILKRAVASKQVKILSGQKRSTTYGLATSKPARKVAKGPKKTAAKKPAKKAKRAAKKK